MALYKKIISKYAGTWDWLFGLLGALSLTGLIYGISKVRTVPYLDYASLIGPIFAGLMALFCGYFLIVRSRIEISRKKLLVQHIFRQRTYAISDIEGYKVRRYYHKNSRGEQIVVKIKSDFVVIDSQYYTNFFRIERYFRNNYTVLAPQHFQRFDFYSALPYRLVTLAFASLFLFLSYLAFTPEESIIHRQITMVESELAADPSVEESRQKGRGKVKNLELQLTDFPDFTFLVRRNSYAVLDQALSDRLTKGKKVSIGCKTEEVQSKLLQVSEPDSRTKHWKWGEVDIYQMEVDGQLIIEAVEVDRRSNSRKDKSKWILLILGLVFLSLILVTSPFYEEVPQD